MGSGSIQKMGDYLKANVLRSVHLECRFSFSGSTSVNTVRREGTYNTCVLEHPYRGIAFLSA